MKRLLSSKMLFLIFCLSILGLSSCKKEAELPIINTGTVSDVLHTTATVAGEAIDEGDSPVISKGICWGSTDSPTISNSKTVERGGLGIFTSSLTQLTANTLYYVRAYATNKSGTAYGTQVTFNTRPISLPALTTNEVASITQTGAISGGNITDNGGNIMVSGICWSTTENPTTNHNKTTNGSQSGSFTSNLTGLTGNTRYYVRAYATNIVGTSYGNQVSFITSPVSPVLTTASITSLSCNSATSGGNITSNGGATITEYGIVWGSSLNPVITDNKITISGSVSGSYSCIITGLTTNTQYHVRAYAVNSIGITYGADISFTTDPVNLSDIDGNIYNVVRIGNQLWMKENLRTTKYRNGDPIGTTATPLTDVTAEASPKYQWAYAGDEANVPVNGRLYTWYAAVDERKVCPAGWHVPTDAEWTMLTDFLRDNGYSYEGTGNYIAKSMASTTGWHLPLSASPGDVGLNPGINNSSGFSAFPSGARVTYYVYGDVVVEFSMLGTSCAWWSSTELTETLAYQRILIVSEPTVTRSYYGTKKTAASVRCLRDN